MANEAAMNDAIAKAVTEATRAPIQWWSCTKDKKSKTQNRWSSTETAAVQLGHG